MSHNEITREFLLNGTRRNGPGFEANQREAAQRFAKGCGRSATPHSTHFPNSPEMHESPGADAAAPNSSGASLGASRNTLLDAFARGERREEQERDSTAFAVLGAIGMLIPIVLRLLA